MRDLLAIALATCSLLSNMALAQEPLPVGPPGGAITVGAAAFRRIGAGAVRRVSDGRRAAGADFRLADRA